MSAIISFILAPLLLLISFNLASGPLSLFWDLKSLLFVILTTLLMTTVSFRVGRLWVLFKVFLRRVAGQHRRHYKEEIKIIIKLARAKRESYDNFVSVRNKIKDPFLRDAAQLLDWAEGEVKTEQLRDLLQVKADTFYKRYKAEALVFEQASEFPLKFGILGALIFSIGHFLSAHGSVNYAMIIGRSLLPILYGYIITHFLFEPVAKNLQDSTLEDRVAREIVVDGILMIHQKFPPQFIEEKVLSYLLPSERFAGSERSI